MAKYAIIYHDDPDGYFSANTVFRYLQEQGNEIVDIGMIMWSYGRSYDDIMTIVREDTKEIYIVDLTLPDDFMLEYADKIIRIDHHLTSINSTHPWDHQLRRDYSAISVPGYIGSDGKIAERISACELTWLTLFPERKMPEYIFLAGRYDVWDHDRYLRTKAFNAYAMHAFTGMHREVFIREDMNRLFSDMTTVIHVGNTIMCDNANLRAQDCRKAAYVTRVFGHKIVVANTAVNTLEFFSDAIKKNPFVVGTLSFYYNIVERIWEATCFSVQDSFSAIDFIQDFRKYINEDDLLSMGGHKNACGFQFKGDAGRFLWAISNTRYDEDGDD